MAQAAEKQSPGVAGTELVQMMAKEQHLDPQKYASTVMKTCFSGETTPEQFMAFLMIAKEHKLNPITREIHAFASRGKVMPIVSIDGWLKIINERPELDGIQFIDNVDDDGTLFAVTCRIYRKDRKMPTEVTEYLEECKMPTEPWKKWPARMLRHKATIQCARYAFGFAGIMDPDEADRLRRSEVMEGTATVIDDEPTSAVKRILSRIEAKGGQNNSAPPAATQSAEQDVEDDSSLPFEDADENVDTETGEITLDKIPGIKKASELTDEQKAYVDDMGGDKSK